ncbi:MAG: hypothetical protein IKM25_01405 [Clostridia bacterium]|nr:hypothetical protein [Clostridia bacterium]
MEINFIDWVSFKSFEIAGTNMTLAEFCAQYSAVQTNWVYTVAGIIGILLLLINKNKKWYWYLFLALYTVMSVTSVGMHTADYGEFEPFKMTTKLLASYVDMSLTELTVWWGACCAAMEFHPGKNKKKTAFISVVTAIMLVVIAVLTYEVFVVHNRPLYIGGGGAPMDGKTGGLSLAEFGCFLTAVPLSISSAQTSRVWKRPKREQSFFLFQRFSSRLLSPLSGAITKSTDLLSATSTVIRSGTFWAALQSLRLFSGFSREKPTKNSESSKKNTKRKQHKKSQAHQSVCLFLIYDY